MSLETVDQCPVCNGRIFKPFLVCKDQTTTGETFHVEQCTFCGFVLTNPRPFHETSPAYYQSAQYISHTGKATGLFDYIYLLIRKFTVKWKYNLVKPHLEKRSLLDLGSGTGTFLQFCQTRKVEVHGVEPSREAREVANSRHIPMFESLDALPDIRYSVITLWHVLEHIYDLEGTLASLKSRLNDNGIIFIAVPNWQSYDANYYKEYWAGYDVPRHVWHFSKTTMTQLAERNGLKVKEIIPMKLDAYYVSLLSAKYAAKKFSFFTVIRALWVGYCSNRKAGNNMNYSSLIYLLQK